MAQVKNTYVSGINKKKCVSKWSRSKCSKYLGEHRPKYSKYLGGHRLKYSKYLGGHKPRFSKHLRERLYEQNICDDKRQNVKNIWEDKI